MQSDGCWVVITLNPSAALTAPRSISIALRSPPGISYQYYSRYSNHIGTVLHQTLDSREYDCPAV